MDLEIFRNFGCHGFNRGQKQPDKPNSVASEDRYVINLYESYETLLNRFDELNSSFDKLSIFELISLVDTCKKLAALDPGDKAKKRYLLTAKDAYEKAQEKMVGRGDKALVTEAIARLNTKIRDLEVSISLAVGNADVLPMPNEPLAPMESATRTIIVAADTEKTNGAYKGWSYTSKKIIEKLRSLKEGEGLVVALNDGNSYILSRVDDGHVAISGKFKCQEPKTLNDFLLGEVLGVDDKAANKNYSDYRALVSLNPNQGIANSGRFAVSIEPIDIDSNGTITLGQPSEKNEELATSSKEKDKKGVVVGEGEHKHQSFREIGVLAALDRSNLKVEDGVPIPSLIIGVRAKSPEDLSFLPSLRGMSPASPPVTPGPAVSSVSQAPTTDAAVNRRAAIKIEGTEEDSPMDIVKTEIQQKGIEAIQKDKGLMTDLVNKLQLGISISFKVRTFYDPESSVLSINGVYDETGDKGFIDALVSKASFSAINYEVEGLTYSPVYLISIKPSGERIEVHIEDSAEGLSNLKIEIRHDGSSAGN